jgi:hypothetical protein
MGIQRNKQMMSCKFHSARVKGYRLITAPPPALTEHPLTDL